MYSPPARGANYMANGPENSAVCNLPTYLMGNSGTAYRCGQAEGKRWATWITIAAVAIFLIYIASSSKRGKSSGSGWAWAVILLILVALAWVFLPSSRAKAGAKDFTASQLKVNRLQQVGISGQEAIRSMQANQQAAAARKAQYGSSATLAAAILGSAAFLR